MTIGLITKLAKYADKLVGLFGSGVNEGIAAFPSKRWPLNLAVENGLNLMISANVRSIWELSYLAIKGSTPGDSSTWIWDPVFQAAADSGGAWYIPDNNGVLSVYLVSKHVMVRINGSLTWFGPPGNRPRVQIKTTPTFTDRNIIQQWDDSWYAAGEVDKNQRPADLNAYSGKIDRYMNLRNIAFYIDSDAGGEVSPIDLVALQETSYFEGLTFNGRTGVEKGWPIRMRTGGGTEVSMNGTSIRNIVVYGQNWRGQLMCKGTGSDLDVDTWVTANSAHKETPFQTSMIDVTLRNLHCEAHCTGQPTFKSEGAGIAISQSFVVVRDLQGDVFDSTGLISLSQITLYPVGGLSTNVTNRATINVVKDSSGGTAESTIRLLKYQPTNMGTIARIVSYSRGSVVLLDSNGVTSHISPGRTNLVLPASALFSSTSPLTIPYRVKGAPDPVHFAEVTIFGRKVSTGAGAVLRVRIMQSNNAAGFAPRTATILENFNWPADTAVALVGDYFVLTTPTDVDGVANMTATASGSIYFNAVNS